MFLAAIFHSDARLQVCFSSIPHSGIQRHLELIRIHGWWRFHSNSEQKEVVAAVLPVQEYWLPTSNLDLLLPPVDVGVFFWEVLSNSAGEPELLCNNRGVDFMEAYADVQLQNLNLYNPDESIESKLVPKKKHGVLSVQVTELKCGGVVVACTFDHRIADAYSANMFLVSWAEMAQSKPLSVLPSFRRSLLNPRRPGSYDPSLDNMYVPMSALPPPKAPQPGDDLLINRLYYVTAEQLSLLQSLATSKSNSCKRTKLESLSAFLWKMVAKSAVTENANQKVCRWAPCNKGAFPGADRLGGGSPSGASFSEDIQQWQSRWTSIVVSSGQRFPVSRVDFGWGMPALGSYHFPCGGEAGYVMPSPVRDGDWVVYMHLSVGR
ncbi:Hydroxycinnamoyltransferase 2 [Vitis vinifera]|uniref:Hydroxycinnamoyltransferase 2 n=1 Tax=Vitis vinifera TaxID=29760 RepID=A0A438G956_VITVI|nr:Hydroxycinnamoyltransferase 2 [Vitis vinifera]